MPFDLSSPRLVLAGNAYGECSGGGRVGMENVTSIVLRRVAEGWGATPRDVCLAPAQFSCWSDQNRHRIEQAAVADPAGWAVALAVADAALNGTLPIRTRDADSYYALSMSRPAYWARPPAHHVYSDHWHAFWAVRPGSGAAPNVSAQTTESLNDAELARVAGGRA